MIIHVGHFCTQYLSHETMNTTASCTLYNLLFVQWYFTANFTNKSLTMYMYFNCFSTLYFVSGFSTKEKIIVAVCTTFGVGCLATTAFLIYRHFRSRHFSVKKPFWTVELTNRNYDDLDFSLLDPITDIPFVYRTDIGEFDNDALLGTEKPHLTMEVDGVDVVS